MHYEDRAIQHLLSVACGLDSMVIGESQILGQVRQALRLAREHGTLGRVLSDLGSLALRAGKRAHTETGIDRAGASLVSVGLSSRGAGARRPGRLPEPGRRAGRRRRPQPPAAPPGASPAAASPAATRHGQMPRAAPRKSWPGCPCWSSERAR